MFIYYLFAINYNYKHYGKSFDFAPSVTKVDSTDIMNLSVLKKVNFYAKILLYIFLNLSYQNFCKSYLIKTNL